MKPSMKAAKWASSNNHKLSYRDADENDTMMMAHFLDQKSSIGIDFIHNCDLPPPLKVFYSPNKMVMSTMNQVCSIAGREQEDDVSRCGEHEKLELLKALRLSQTRGREAEKRAASLEKERDCISRAFFEDSLRLLAYRQWTRLLDVQVSKLQSQCRQKKEEEEDDDNDGQDGIEVSWFMAFAFCLSIVGVGVAFGCRYLF